MKVLLLLILFSPLSFSAVDLVGIKLPYRLTLDKNTPYQKIIRDFKQKKSVIAKLHTRPLTRAVQDFLNQKKLCLLPTSIMAMNIFYPEQMKKLKVVQSHSIENVIATIFSKNGTPPIKKTSEVNGKIIATWNGIYADKLLPKINYKVIKISKDQQSLALLKNKRVDYIIGFLPDTPLVAEKLGFAPPVYNKNISLIKTTVHILCHDTPKAKIFLNQFNVYLEKIKNSGELQQILGKHSIVTD